MESVRPASVTDLNRYIKALIEGNDALRTVYVTGEISNFTAHMASGHMYLTLKDDNSSIKAVMFKSYASRLKFRPENGMKVIVLGNVSVYERNGQYQLYIESMQPDGTGALSIAFEQLKKRLADEGMFDDSHKKKLPAYPMKIGVVTAPDGAAVRDIFNITKRRFPCAEIILAPVQVQGDSAAEQISNAVKRLDDEKLCDVIIVGRGGGSIEDLWAFNEEAVARSVYSCQTPVISAVGHETDFTICDFVADLRAPTPSAAAELCVPDMNNEKQIIASYISTSRNSISSKINSQRSIIEGYSKTQLGRNPKMLINERRLLLDSTMQKNAGIINGRINREKSILGIISGKLIAYSPEIPLKHGYSLVRKNNKIVSSAHSLKNEDVIEISMNDGKVNAVVKEII